MKKLILIALLISPLSARAENLTLKYEADWNGLKAGEAKVILNETGNFYTDKVSASSGGLVKNFTNYWTDNTVTGTINNGEYQPSVFNTTWQPKKATTQNVVVSYAKDGTVSEVATPPERRGKYPEVAKKDKHGLPDPISAAMTARAKIRHIVESGARLPQSFSIRIFDSRRVTGLNFNVLGYERVKGQKLLKVSFTRTPITGYRKKELEVHNSMNPLINIYADDKFIPVLATGQSIIGPVTLKLVDKQ